MFNDVMSDRSDMIGSTNTVFFTQISTILESGTVPTILHEKSGCHRTVRQTATRLKLCIAADRESPMTDE